MILRSYFLHNFIPTRMQVPNRTMLRKTNLMDIKNYPAFYVVTVNYYSSSFLQELIDSFKPLNFIRKFFIINHSPEEHLDDLQAPFALKIINQKNTGYGAGLNRGLLEISEKDAIVLCCNPDVVLLTPGELLAAINYLCNNPQIGCLIPQSLAPDAAPLYPCRTFYSWKSLFASRISYFRKNPPNWYRKLFCMNLSESDPTEVDWGCGAILLYRMFSLGEISAFDENFFLYFEDVDLCTRLWQAGLSVVFYPKLVFEHHVKRESHTSWRYLFYHIASLIRYIRKYKGLPRRIDLLRPPK